MSTTTQNAEERQHEIAAILRNIQDNIYQYIFSDESSEMRSDRVELIKLFFDKLNRMYGVNVNAIYRNYNDVLKRLFTNKNPDNALLDYLIAQGFDVNTIIHDGQYPLYQACAAGNSATAQYLLQRHAKFDLPYRGHTAAGIASVNSDFNIKDIESDPQCANFSEQYHVLQQSLLLAHRFSLNGSGYLGNNYFPTLTYLDPEILRGSLCDSFLKISQRNVVVPLELFADFAGGIRNLKLEQLINNIASQMKSTIHPTAEGIIRDIKDGKVCPIALGTVFPDRGYHHEGIIFYNGLLIRANRGEGSDGRTGVEINQIDHPEKIVEIVKMLDEQQFQGLDANTLHQNLEKLLGLKRIDLIEMQEQRSPTCKWTSEKAIFMGVIYCEILDYFRKQGVDLKTAHENALNIARPWYKAFTIQDRVDAINSFLDGFPKKRIHEMPPLVQEMLLKIYQHAMRKEKYKPIVMLLQNRDMESFALLNQQFLKALQEGAEEKEILSYIQQGIIGNLHIRFEPVLRILIDKGYTLAAKELLIRGASPEPVPPAMLSILNKAIERENLQIVGLLLARGADPKYHAEDIAKLREKKLAAESLPNPEKRPETRVTEANLLIQFSNKKPTLLQEEDTSPRPDRPEPPKA